MLGDGAFTRQQIAVLSQLVDAIISDRINETDPRGLIPATVLSYDPRTRYALVTLDSDLGDIGPAPSTRVFNKGYAQMQPDDRVFVEFVGDDGGAFVDGTIRTTDILVGCVMRDAVYAVPDASLKVFTGLDTVVYDPFSMYDPVTGLVTIPDSGLWSASLIISNPGSGFLRVFAELAYDGFRYRSANYFSGTAADPYNNAVIPPTLMNAGEKITPRAFQDSAGAVNMSVRLDVWKVQQGRLYT